jgi:hypothetical protein
MVFRLFAGGLSKKTMASVVFIDVCNHHPIMPTCARFCHSRDADPSVTFIGQREQIYIRTQMQRARAYTVRLSTRCCLQAQVLQIMASAINYAAAAGSRNSGVSSHDTKQV